MANVLPREQQISALHHLIEGNTLRSVTRLTGVHRTTSQKLLVDFGANCKAFMDRELRGLTLNHVEIDEIWSFVGKKQARLTVDEKRERHDIGDIFVWYGIDQDTKLAPSFVIGKRSADNARRLMMDLRGRLAFTAPTPGQTDARNYQPEWRPIVTQISTDGLAAYPEAVDLAFGANVKFGTIIKEYKNARMTYDPSEMVGTKRRGIFGIDPDEVYSICTSHIERANLTMRTLMKRFTRLSLGFSKKLANMEAACALFFAYYNFVWRTRHDDNSGQSGRLRPTAAMMAGVTDTLWSFENLFDAVNG